MSTILGIQHVPLSTVKRWERNPKQHNLGALIQSIQRYGFRDAPIYDATLDAIVGGNGRIEALEIMQAQDYDLPAGLTIQNGEWCVPIQVGVNARTVSEAEAFSLDHNNLVLSGGDFTAIDMSRAWNAQYLDVLQELAQQDELPISVDGDDLDALLAYHAPEPEALDDAPVSVDETKPTRCQPGDVWRVGRHLVACLDSTDAAHIERLVQGRRVGMVVADPPYAINAVDEETGQTGGLGRPGGGYPFGGAKNDGKSKPIKSRVYDPVIGDDSTETAEQASGLCLSLFPDALQFWWGANNYAHVLPPSTCWIVWDKDNGTNAFADAELCWSNHDGAVRIFKHMWNGMLRASEQGARVHPTQKPIALFDWLYNRYGSAGDLIVDPFLGSGPSLKAAEVSGRTVVGFELSPAYIDHILEWAEARGLTVERVETPHAEVITP